MKSFAKARYQTPHLEALIASEVRSIPKLTIETFSDYLRIGIQHDALDITFDLGFRTENSSKMWTEMLVKMPASLKYNVPKYHVSYECNWAIYPTLGRMQLYDLSFHENHDFSAEWKILLCRPWANRILKAVADALGLDYKYPSKEELNLSTLLNSHTVVYQGSDYRGQTQVVVHDSHQQFYSMMFLAKGIIRQEELNMEKMKLTWLCSEKSNSFADRNVVECSLTLPLQKITESKYSRVDLPELFA